MKLSTVSKELAQDFKELMSNIGTEILNFRRRNSGLNEIKLLEKELRNSLDDTFEMSARNSDVLSIEVDKPKTPLVQQCKNLIKVQKDKEVEPSCTSTTSSQVCEEISLKSAIVKSNPERRLEPKVLVSTDKHELVNDLKSDSTNNGSVCSNVNCTKKSKQDFEKGNNHAPGLIPVTIVKVASELNPNGTSLNSKAITLSSKANTEACSKKNGDNNSIVGFDIKDMPDGILTPAYLSSGSIADSKPFVIEPVSYLENKVVCNSIPKSNTKEVSTNDLSLACLANTPKSNTINCTPKIRPNLGPQIGPDTIGSRITTGIKYAILNKSQAADEIKHNLGLNPIGTNVPSSVTQSVKSSDLCLSKLKQTTKKAKEIIQPKKRPSVQLLSRDKNKDFTKVKGVKDCTSPSLYSIKEHPHRPSRPLHQVIRLKIHHSTMHVEKARHVDSSGIGWGSLNSLSVPEACNSDNETNTGACLAPIGIFDSPLPQRRLAHVTEGIGCAKRNSNILNYTPHAIAPQEDDGSIGEEMDHSFSFETNYSLVEEELQINDERKKSLQPYSTTPSFLRSQNDIDPAMLSPSTPLRALRDESISESLCYSPSDSIPDESRIEENYPEWARFGPALDEKMRLQSLQDARKIFGPVLPADPVKIFGCDPTRKFSVIPYIPPWNPATETSKAPAKEPPKPCHAPPGRQRSTLVKTVAAKKPTFSAFKPFSVNPVTRVYKSKKLGSKPR